MGSVFESVLLTFQSVKGNAREITDLFSCAYLLVVWVCGFLNCLTVSGNFKGKIGQNVSPVLFVFFNLI